MTPTNDDDDMLDISFDDEDENEDTPDEQETPDSEQLLDIDLDESTQPTETGPEDEPPNICPNCGYDLMPLEDVCPRCGRDTTESVEESSEAQPGTESQEDQDQAPTPTVVETDSDTQSEEYPSPEEPSGCSASPCLIVSGCLLAVILLVSGVVFFGVRHLASQYGGSLGAPEAQSERPIDEGPVTALDESSFNDRVLRSEGWALVEFGADWCPPCKQLEPIYHDLAAEYEGKIKFYSVDTDVSPKLGDRYVDRGIPTLVMFHNGRQMATRVGFANKPALRKWIETTLR